MQADLAQPRLRGGGEAAERLGDAAGRLASVLVRGRGRIRGKAWDGAKLGPGLGSWVGLMERAGLGSGPGFALGVTWSRTLTCLLSQLESTRRASLHVACSARSSGMLPLATSHSASSVSSAKDIRRRPAVV